MFNNHQFDHEHLKNITRPPTPEEEQVEDITDDKKVSPQDETGKGDQLTGSEEVVEPGEKKTVPTENVVEPSKRSTILNLLKKLAKAKPKEEKTEEKPAKKKSKKKKFKSVRLKKAKTKVKKCYKRFIIFLNSTKALFSRLLYILHALITVWRVTVVIGDWYWVVISWLGFMVIELLLVIFKRAGREWKWIQPCILIYLMVELPSICLLELHKVAQLQMENNSSHVILGDLLAAKAESDDGPALQIAALDAISDDWWALLLEQSMLVLIIIARWLMPKGDMNRDQLSALLLFYLGTASDIVDFFSVISEDEALVTSNYTFLFTILGFWSWSMLQFIFLVTMTKSDEAEEEEGEDSESEPESGDEDSPNIKKNLIKKDKLTFKERFMKKMKIFLASEAWSILISMIFQDGPYAAVRVVCLVHWNIRTYTNYFFTAKNIMVLFLQIYRLLAVYEEYKAAKKEAKKKKKEARKKLLQSSVRRVTFASRLLGGLRNRKKDNSTSASDTGAVPRLSHKVQLHNLHQPNPIVTKSNPENNSGLIDNTSHTFNTSENRTSLEEMGYSRHCSNNSNINRQNLMGFAQSNNISSSSSSSSSLWQKQSGASVSKVSARTKPGASRHPQTIAVSVSESVEALEQNSNLNETPKGKRTLGGLSMSKSVSHGDCIIELGAYAGFNDLKGQTETATQKQSPESHDLGVAEINVQDLSQVSVM